jgi:hypothetical protein
MTVNEEVEAFYAALGRAITQWAAVEYGLKETYHASLGDVSFWMCSAVFYAVDSFRAKLQMVDAAVKMATPQRLQDWQKLHARIEAKATIRNKLAHFTVINFPQGKSGRRINLRPNIFDPRHLPINSKRPMGGYFLQDLEAIPGQFSSLAHALENFAARVGGKKEPWPKHLELEPQQRPKAVPRKNS